MSLTFIIFDREWLILTIASAYFQLCSFSFVDRTSIAWFRVQSNVYTYYTSFWCSCTVHPLSQISYLTLALIERSFDWLHLTNRFEQQVAGASVLTFCGKHSMLNINIKGNREKHKRFTLKGAADRLGRLAAMCRPETAECQWNPANCND